MVLKLGYLVQNKMPGESKPPPKEGMLKVSIKETSGMIMPLHGRTVWHRNIAPNFQIKKSMVFLTVNLHEILHASIYGIY